jgi:hypothetical protein
MEKVRSSRDQSEARAAASGQSEVRASNPALMFPAIDQMLRPTFPSETSEKIERGKYIHRLYTSCTYIFTAEALFRM